MEDARAKPRANPSEGFRHDALLYAGAEDFLRRTSSFIREGLGTGEPILVAVSAEKIGMLRTELGDDARRVRFADMAQIGGNPARIIPVWRDFVAEQQASGRRARGIGEPIWAARSADELAECERHEALLNLAFSDAPPWWLSCPYDTESLAPAVMEEAHRNHPFVVDDGKRRESPAYRGLEDVASPFDRPLPEPGVVTRELSFGTGSDGLGHVRAQVAEEAAAFGLDEVRSEDLILVANEVATNSLRHGGGRGLLRIWQDDASMICEIRDAGRIDDPLVGRGQPGPDQVSGFGLWLANQLCDLVQIRTFPTGSVVRLHVRR